MKLLRIAIIGLGHIGNIHIQAINSVPGIKLVSACDMNADLISIVPRNVNFYNDYKEMLSIGGFEAVIVATSTNSHNSISIDVLNAGYNVVVEKPASKNINELQYLEKVINKTGKHIYFALHAAEASEVIWFAKYLKKNINQFGDLTSFSCHFSDPYFDDKGKLKKNALSLGDCWSDSGINALSVIDKFLLIDNLLVKEKYLLSSSNRDVPANVLVYFDYKSDTTDLFQFGKIRTAWDENINFKSTELIYKKKGWRVVINHSKQTVIAYDNNDAMHKLVHFEGNRLLNHYVNLFTKYLKSYNSNLNNFVQCKRIHLKLFEAKLA